MSIRQEVFFETTYNYRRWFVYFFIVLFGGLFVFVGAGSCVSLSQVRIDADHWLAVLAGVVFSLLWLAGTGSIAGTLLYLVLFRPVVDSRIDSEGIKIFNRMHPWPTIASLSGIQRRPWGRRRMGLQFTRRSWWPLAAIQGIPMEPISFEEYEALYDRLEPFLETHFPHVQLD
jgi:hypothetical protein